MQPPQGAKAPLSPVLVLALDGASFDVIEPMVAAGRLPNLARWMETGSARPLPSTTPPVTFPAWSSFMTGLEPGDHGIFDFTQKLPDQYRIRFVNASDRAGESVLGAVGRAGGRVLVLGLPATYPPEPVRGLLVPGFDAPVSSGSDAASTSDPDLYARIAAKAGPWMRPDLDESAKDERFHERAVETLLARIARKERFALTALGEMTGRGERPDLVVIVFSESDTVGHHYWRDHDPASPRHDANASDRRKDAIRDVYERLDAACGALRGAFDEDALCIVVSDHGMGGASRNVVHLNRFLEQEQLLVRHAGRGRALDDAAKGLRDLALRLLPAGLGQWIFRRARGAAGRLESAARFGGFDWTRTVAFSEEVNTNPGIWINLRGREAAGCVDADDYEATRDRIIEALQGWRLPGGGRVVARARRREDVYRGPFVERAPDIVVELALDEGYGLSLVPTPWSLRADTAPSAAEQGELAPVRRLGDEELAGGRGRGMNGTHRSEGIFIATGRDASLALARTLMPARLSEMAPTMARGLGLDWAPKRTEGDEGRARRDYSDEEDAMVAARLRALGYIE
jgi:predicted AlkP superfamily phosphohydrolase/phosphomutase